MNLEVLSFVFYFVLMLGIGVFFFFKDKNAGEKDYFLGGRSMGPWVTAMSAQASDMSAWLLMGLPGSIMAFGFGQVWIGIGLMLGTAANWIFVAKRLRCFSKAAGDSITLPQYLSNRFASKSPVLQVICAVIFLVFFTLYVASAFIAGTGVFTTLFPELDPAVARTIFASVILIYTFLGGFKAVCWTDFFQGLLMLAAVLAVPIVISQVWNLDVSVLNQIPAEGYLFETNLFAVKWQDIASGLAWGLGYFGMPHILVRFMSIKKPSMIRKSATVAIVWVVLALTAVCVIAWMGRMVVGNELLLAGKQEMVFIELARKFFPPVIAGVLMAAIMAASMSTADSQLLVASSSFTSDIYKPMLRKNAGNKEVLWVGRLVVVIVSVVAFFIAGAQGEGVGSIMSMVDNAWGGFGSAFGPVMILSLFWRRFTYKGAVAGVVVGAVADVLWLVYLTDTTGVYELLPGFIAGFIAAVVVTLLDKKPTDEVTAVYDAAMVDVHSGE